MSSLGQLVKFVPVLERACRFYVEGVRLILDVVCITLPYAAGSLGSGFEVLGTSNVMSIDHRRETRLLLCEGGGQCCFAGRRSRYPGGASAIPTALG